MHPNAPRSYDRDIVGCWDGGTESKLENVLFRVGCNPPKTGSIDAHADACRASFLDLRGRGVLEVSGVYRSVD